MITYQSFPDYFAYFHLAVMILGYHPPVNITRVTAMGVLLKGIYEGYSHIAGRIKGYSECTEEVKVLLDQYKLG